MFPRYNKEIIIIFSAKVNATELIAKVNATDVGYGGAFTLAITCGQNCGNSSIFQWLFFSGVILFI